MRSGRDAMPSNDEIEEVLAWGPDGDPVVDRKAEASDLVPRFLTGLAAAAAAVVVAIGLADRTAQQASETVRGQPPPFAAQQLGTQPGSNPIPPCPAGQRHTPCRWDPFGIHEAVVDGWAMPYLTGPSKPTAVRNADADCLR
jgi:hypothetical protein